jgi:hypothetical protein
VKVFALEALLLVSTACRIHFDERADATVVDTPTPMCGSTGVDVPAWPMPNDPGSGLPHPALYTGAAGMIHDDVTGLTWERDPSTTQMTSDQARNYCNTLSLNGACWRLPQRIELVSIVNYLAGNPAATIPSTISTRYWSATPGPPGQSWAINFGAGHVEPRTMSEMNQVRCVQVTVDPPANRYTIIDTDTARDESTGLQWQRNVDPGSYTFSAAQTYCNGLPGGGWRMPSIHELLTIIDTSRSTILADPVAFPATPPQIFWSQTAMFLDTTMGWSVDFAQGLAFRNQGTMLRVRCVHD